MKNACKKLFSLLLAAVLLVSVVPFQALAAETDGTDVEPLTDGVQTYTVIVYDENGWKENITVEAGGVVDAKYLSEKYDVEGYKTVWNDGNFVPGESRINSDNFVIGCKYEKLVTKYSVEFYAGEEWIGGIKVGTDGKILDGTVPTAPTKPGMEFTGWFHSAGEYKPGKTKITGDLVVGAQYEETKKPEDDKHPGNRPGDNDDDKHPGNRPGDNDDDKHPGNRPGDRDEKTFVITFEHDDHSIKAYSFDKKTNDLSVSEELAQWALEKARLDDEYKLDDNFRRKEFEKGRDGKYYATVKLDKKASSTKIELTIYVDGNKKPVVDGKKITVKTNESFKNDHEDWLRKAWDKYSRYDYDVKDWESNKAKDEYTVWLTSRKGSNNDEKYTITLDIYINGNTKKAAKSVKITNGIAADGKVSMNEVKGIVKEYYTAKDSKGIDYEGLWLNKDKFDRHEDHDTINVSEYHKNKKDVTIVVMANNVKAKTNSNADSTNPKTGDEIYMVITVMTISAAALACAYVLNKKRIVK